MRKVASYRGRGGEKGRTVARFSSQPLETFSSRNCFAKTTHPCCTRNIAKPQRRGRILPRGNGTIMWLGPCEGGDGAGSVTQKVAHGWGGAFSTKYYFQ